MRKRVFDLLDGSDREYAAGRAVNLFLILLILANVAAVILEAVAGLGARHSRAFYVFGVVAVIVLTVGVGLRSGARSFMSKWLVDSFIRFFRSESDMHYFTTVRRLGSGSK